MGLEDTNGIAAAQDGREVVGFVHVLNQNCEVGHALVQYRTQPLETTGEQRHETLLLCVLRVWDADLGHIQTHRVVGLVTDLRLASRTIV